MSGYTAGAMNLRSLLLVLIVPAALAAQQCSAPPAAAPPPPQIKAGINAGKLIFHTAPVYPAEAKAKGIEGTVKLHAAIAKDGTISNLEPISGPPELMSAAMDAVQSWRYEPYTLNGEPTEVATTITVNFNLSGGSHPARISSGVMQGMLVSSVPPEYPEVAKMHHVSGTVVVHAIINKEGKVQSLDVLSGPMELQASAKQAVSQWRYKPYLLNGAPVEVETTIMVNFNINNSVRF